jgi:hypothetical protein
VGPIFFSFFFFFLTPCNLILTSHDLHFFPGDLVAGGLPVTPAPPYGWISSTSPATDVTSTPPLNPALPSWCHGFPLPSRSSATAPWVLATATRGFPPPRASTSMSSVAHIPSYFAAPHGILSSSQKPPRARSFLPSPLPMGVGCWCRRSDSQPFGTVAAEPSLATEQAQMPPCYKLQPLVLQRKGGGKLLMSSLLGAPGAAARSDLGCHLCYQRRARVLPKHAGADTCGRQHCC